MKQRYEAATLKKLTHNLFDGLRYASVLGLAMGIFFAELVQSIKSELYGYAFFESVLLILLAAELFDRTCATQRKADEIIKGDPGN